MTATLILQDDFGQVADANAYIDVTYFKSYMDNLGFDYTTPAYSNNTISIAIIKATEYMDTRFRFYGIRKQINQSTSWPRYDISDVDGSPVNVIPPNVKKACAQYASIALTEALNPAPTRDPSGARVIATTTQVGPILDSVRFAGAAIFVQPSYPIPDGLLRSRGYVIASNSLTRG